MLRLLKLEYLKNLSYKPFKVFLIIYFSMLALLLFIGVVKINFLGFDIALKDQGIYNFPGLWNFTTWIVGLLKLFLGFIIVLSVHQEFANRMFKQNIIDGLSKKEFLTSKLLTIGVFATISTLIVFVVSLLLGISYSKEVSASLIFQEIYFIPAYFLKLVTFFCLLLFLTILFRNAVFVFLTFFVLWIIEGIIGAIEFTSMRSVTYSTYFPLETISSIVPNPVRRTEMANALGQGSIAESVWTPAIVCILYTLLYVLWSYRILQKKDW